MEWLAPSLIKILAPYSQSIPTLNPTYMNMWRIHCIELAGKVWQESLVYLVKFFRNSYICMFGGTSQCHQWKQTINWWFTSIIIEHIVLHNLLHPKQKTPPSYLRAAAQFIVFIFITWWFNFTCATGTNCGPPASLTLKRLLWHQSDSCLWCLN